MIEEKASSWTWSYMNIFIYVYMQRILVVKHALVSLSAYCSFVCMKEFTFQVYIGKTQNVSLGYLLREASSADASDTLAVASNTLAVASNAIAIGVSVGVVSLVLIIIGVVVVGVKMRRHAESRETKRSATS